jgi:hypothetical protein
LATHGFFDALPLFRSRLREASLIDRDLESEVARIRRVSGLLSPEDQATLDRYASELEREFAKRDA